MRLREDTIGALNLFRTVPGAFSLADVRVGQALADVATIGLLNARTRNRGLSDLAWAFVAGSEELPGIVLG
jgi:hypothetical protein